MTAKVDSLVAGSACDAVVRPLRDTLFSESIPLAQRFRALFSLKHLASQKPPVQQTVEAVEAIAAAFNSPSALLKHELAYCLGQTQNINAVPHLRRALEDHGQDDMCRHEAAEALGALGAMTCVDLMTQMRDDDGEPTVVRETCSIAVDKLLWEQSDASRKETLKKSDFASIDPAPPLPRHKEPFNITHLQSQLLDTKLPLFQRYRAMFALRDLASPPDLPSAVPAINALAAGFSDRSALFRHEIAFVFGQLSHPASIPSLTATLTKEDEASMVRHEAAEALGSLGDQPGVEDLLKSFSNDPEQVVRESVIVALDMAEYEKKGEMEYAIVPPIEVA